MIHLLSGSHSPHQLGGISNITKLHTGWKVFKAVRLGNLISIVEQFLSISWSLWVASNRDNLPSYFTTYSPMLLSFSSWDKTIQATQSNYYQRFQQQVPCFGVIKYWGFFLHSSPRILPPPAVSLVHSPCKQCKYFIRKFIPRQKPHTMLCFPRVILWVKYQLRGHLRHGLSKHSGRIFPRILGLRGLEWWHIVLYEASLLPRLPVHWVVLITGKPSSEKRAA